MTSVKVRFEQFCHYENIFGFLFSCEKLKSLTDIDLEKKYLELCENLKYDIDGYDFCSELKVLRVVLEIDVDFSLKILSFISRIDSFSNCFNFNRILLTIPVAVASAERSFS